MTEYPSPILAKKRPGNLFDVAVLLLYPPLLALLNSNWIFTPPMLTPDPWFYLGYFRYWPQYAPSFPSYQHYFVERLSWNVPGYMIYQLLPPEWANYALHLLVAWTALLSLYGVLRLLVSRRAGLFAALLMGGYPFFLRAVGWDYPDGAGMALFLLLLFLLALAARVPRRSGLLLFAAGLALAALLMINVSWLGFTPAWLLVYLYVCSPQARRPLALLRAAVFLLLGALALTGAAALYYRVLTGDYFFLRNTVRFSTMLVDNQQNARDVRAYYGWMPPYWHVLPLLACLLAALRLARKTGRYTQPLVPFAAVLVWSYLWLLYFHFRSVPYLVIYSYCTYLIPSTFLLLGVLAAPALEKFSERAVCTLALTGMFLMALPHLLSWLYPAITWAHGNQTVMWVTLALMLLAFSRLQRLPAALLALAGFTVLFYQGGINIGVFLPDRFAYRDNFRMVIDAADALDRHYPQYNYDSYRLWYRIEPNMHAAFSLASVKLYPWGSAVVANSGAQLEWPADVPVYPADIVLLSGSTPPDVLLEQANALLAPKGASLELQSIEQFAHGGQRMTMIFTNLITPALTYGERIEFDRQMGGARNFYDPEINAGRSFMWTGGLRPRSELRLSLQKPQKDVQVTFCALSSLRPDTPQTFALYVNDVPVGLELSANADCPMVFKGVIPADTILPLDAPNVVAWQFDELSSPKELGINADPRPLGLAIDWLVLDLLP